MLKFPKGRFVVVNKDGLYWCVGEPNWTRRECSAYIWYDQENAKNHCRFNLPETRVVSTDVINHYFSLIITRNSLWNRLQDGDKYALLSE